MLVGLSIAFTGKEEFYLLFLNVGGGLVFGFNISLFAEGFVVFGGFYIHDFYVWVPISTILLN